jgi:hypothetical protein
MDAAWQQAQEYVQSLRAQGFSDEQIGEQLAQSGWQPDQIQQLISGQAPSATPEPLVSSAQPGPVSPTPVGGGYQTPAPGEVKKAAAGVSIAALVLGIASVVVCCTPLLGIPGLICGIISLRSDQGSGRTMGMVGLILSIIAIVIGTILGIMMIAAGGIEEFMEGFEAGYSGYY